MSRYQPAPSGLRRSTHVFNQCNSFELLTDRNASNIVPFFLHMVFYLGKLNEVTAQAKFRALEFEVVQDVSNQDPLFNIALPYVFLYLFSLVPKNTGDSLTAHLLKREKGLISHLLTIDLVGQAGNYVIPMEALDTLQEFLNLNTDVLHFSTTLFIGISNVPSRHVALAYATELIPSVQFGNMNGVDIIENHFLTVGHPSMTNTMVNASYQIYLKFKIKAMNDWGELWPYFALLRKDEWNKYARLRGMKRMRIIATMFASDETPSYGGIRIDDITIDAYKSTHFYKDIYRAFCSETQGMHSIPNATYGEGSINKIYHNISLTKRVSGEISLLGEDSLRS